MNKDGKYITIDDCGPVDDCKISHKDEKAVTDILERLEDKFRKETSIAVTQGPIHYYLGMTIDYISWKEKSSLRYGDGDVVICC